MWRSHLHSTRIWYSQRVRTLAGWVAELGTVARQNLPSSRRRYCSSALSNNGVITDNGVTIVGAGRTVASTMVWAGAGLLSLALTSAVAASLLAPGPRGAVKETSKVAVKARPGKLVAAPANKEPFGTIPKGPLQIIISLDHQTLHLYSDGEKIAETLVASGVPAHPTPMGVFSVIQKSRDHHSNIYSGAPMPFMHRITWSGVALHEGVGMGHPASHGCIRLSRDFVTRLWGISRLGARVVIARQQLSPQEFADPHLFVHAVKSTSPSAQIWPAEVVKTAQTVDNNKSSDAPPVTAAAPADPMPVLSQQGKDIDLRPDLKIDTSLKSNPNMAPDMAHDVVPKMAPSTAPARAEQSRLTVAQSKAGPPPDVPARDAMVPNTLAAAAHDAKPDASIDAAKETTGKETSAKETKPESPPVPASVVTQAPPAIPAAAPAQTPVTAQATTPPQTSASPSTSAAPPAAPVAQTPTAAITPIPDQTPAASAPGAQAPGAQMPAAQAPAPAPMPASAAAVSTSAKPENTSATKAEAEAQHDSAPAVPRGSEPAANSLAVPAAASEKPDDVPMPLPKPADVAHAPQNTPIAIFISRKEKKIFVRQDFSPLFDAPVTIEESDRPLGTMVFTALNFLDDHATLRWNVILVPDQRPARKGEPVPAAAKPVAAKEVVDKRGRDHGAAVESWMPPEAPDRALARIEIAPDTVARISELIVPGSSLVISDQGLGEETGEGTDFIVVTH